MGLRNVAAFGAALMLCACSQRLMQAKDDYQGIDPQPFAVEGEDVWRVFDSPAANKLMITPSLSKIAMMGMASGGALDPPQTTYERAAMDYLRSTGRTCRLVRTELVQRPQWEIQYDCSVPAGVAMPPARAGRRS